MNYLAALDTAKVLKGQALEALDESVVISNFTNRAYQGEFGPGREVRVAEFPTLVGTHKTYAERTYVIEAKNTSVPLVGMTVNQLVENLRRYGVEEKAFDSINFEEHTAREFGQSIAVAHDRHVAVVAATEFIESNQLNKVTPYTTADATIYDELENMVSTLSEQDVKGSVALFGSPRFVSAIKKSQILDSTDEGLLMRLTGMLSTEKRTPILKNEALRGMVSGMLVYETNTIPGRYKLTLDTQPTAGQILTVTVRDQELSQDVAIEFEFVAAGTAANPGEISLGANAAGTQANFINAIRGTGTAGASTYIDISAYNRNLMKSFFLTISDFATDVTYITFARKNYVTITTNITGGANALSAKREVVIAMDALAVNFVEEISEFAIREGENGAYSNMFYKNYFQAAVIGRNNRRGVTNDVIVS